MPAQEKNPRGRKLLAVMVLALLTALSAVNIRITLVPLSKLIRQDIGFEDFAAEVREGYISDSFIGKSAFVNLNGAFARLTGRRTLNEVVKLNNGMLSAAVESTDVTALAGEITDLSDFLSERNISFLYIQLPDKESLDGRSFPVGVPSYRNSNEDDLLSQLSAAGVESLDLRPLMSQTQEMLEQYFCMTDHHWNADGAFKAFQEVLQRLRGSFPEGNIDLTYAQADQWQRHSIDDWFLGSRGKRVGIYFGGTDPLIWYTPKFETEMSCAVPIHGWLYRGDFTEANIRTQYIEEKNYYHSNPYCVYIGGDYGLVQHRNPGAPSPLKLMIIKDSFALPLQAFLSTVFQEIDVIDPREFSDCSIAEYVERTRPDIVILPFSSGALSHPAYLDYGLEETISVGMDQTFFESAAPRDIEVGAIDNDYNYTAYALEAGAVYRVTFDAVDITEGQTEGAGLVLYDKTIDTVLERTVFDLAYCEEADGFSWIFRTPDTRDELQLLFYAGIYGSTAGNGVIYRNVTLEKCAAAEIRND